MSLLEIKDLTKRFGGLVAVDSLSFVVHPGETVSLIGPNGAGKTTVFNMITGFTSPSSGRVVFGGIDLVGMAPHEVARAGIGRTFQVVKPLRSLTVFENVLVGAFAKFADRKRASEAAEDTLSFTGLLELRNKMAGSLTLAMQKRLELARSLASGPRLMLLDEVMSGLTPGEADQAIDLIVRLRDERGISSVAGIEHVMRVVMSISDRVIVLNHGKKIAEGSPEEVSEQDAVIEAYLGK